MPMSAKKQRLLTPGPTQVPDEVLRELACPIIHHRTDQFRSILAEVGELLQRVFRTEQPVLTLSGSGTTAFEAAQISLVKPGSKVITVASGKFGERWQDVYDAYGDLLSVRQIRINLPWGDAVQPERLGQALAENPDVSVVVVVHSETSTATACDLQAIADQVRAFGQDALLLVDGITSVGALPIEMDAWGVDVLVTGSQKALMAPPGLGYVALGKRAVARLAEIKPRGYFLDLRKWLESWRENDVPFTPPVNLIRGQRIALQMMLDEGMPDIWARTANMAKATRAAFEVMGLQGVSIRPTDSLSGAQYPPGIQDAAFRAALRGRHGIHIAGGHHGRGAQWKGKIFRISHMGHIDGDDMLAAIAAIECELRAAGYDGFRGSGIDSGRQVLSP